ncbi:IclR family transcriptional regulator [Pseudonocardia sp. MH-G8]|nr:IclR family transcriptional regulator [Pseudonocardia sp. MH-G8]
MAVNEVRSVMTALRVLDEVAAREPVGVSELARALEIPKSSVQRTLRTLHAAGWIQPIGAEMTRWGLTTHMLRTGQRAAGGLNLRDVAVPVMEKLRSATQETVHLAVSEQDKVIVIERLDSPQPVRTFIPLGMAAPIYASANGKAILATWREEELTALIHRGLPVHTSTTITDEGELRARLNEVRRLGYAVNDEEWRTGVSAVAAAITADDGSAIAGLSISTPAQRMSRKLQGRYGELLKDAVRQISAALGRGRH